MKKLVLFLYFLLANFFLVNIVIAEEYSINQATEEYIRLGLKIPTKERDGRVQTLNRKGAMSPGFDQITKDFIEFAKNKKVLEIGGAYGSVMIETLKRYPGTIYHLNVLISDIFLSQLIVLNLKNYKK